MCYIVFRKGYDTMIKRHIYNQILDSVKSKPVTLITGARQVGKLTLAFEFEKWVFLMCHLIVQEKEKWPKKIQNYFYKCILGH